MIQSSGFLLAGKICLNCSMFIIVSLYKRLFTESINYQATDPFVSRATMNTRTNYDLTISFGADAALVRDTHPE